MTYQLKLSNNTILAQVSDRSTDQSTSLNLVGRGSVLFGTSILENFVYLLENFSNSAPPERPLVGQLWFDNSVSLLKVYNTSNSWVPVSDNGTFGNTGLLNQGTLVSGALSSRIRLAGTVGVTVVGGAGSTTVAITLAEGTIIYASTEYPIDFLNLPQTIQISGYDIPFAGLFPNGLVPGVNLAQQQIKLRYAGDTGIADAIAGVPYLLSGSDDGTVNALHVNVAAVLSSYAKFLPILTSPAYTNTGPSTLAVNSLPPRPIVRLDGTQMQAGDLVAGALCRFVYDGSSFQLDQMLSSQANAIDQISGILVQTAGNTAAITTEQQVRSTATSALAQQITTLLATTADNSAQIQQVQTVSTTQTSALAQTLSTLQASVAAGQSDINAKYSQLTQAQADQNTSLVQQVTSLQSTYAANTASINSKLTTQASASASLTSSLTDFMASTANNIADYTQYYNTTASTISALSQSVTTLQSSVAGSIANITTIAQAASDASGASASLVQTMKTTYDGEIASIQQSLSTVSNASGQTSSLVTTLKNTYDGQIATLTQQVSNAATASGQNSSLISQIQQNVDSNYTNYQNSLTAQTTKDAAIVQQITDLGTTVGNNYADVNTKITSQATANSATASRVDSLTTTVGQNSASIQSLTSSVNGNQVQYQLVGNINGTTGGFTFTGVKTPDGAVYNMVFNSNVQITGNLLVGGSVDYGSLVPGQVPRIAIGTTLYVDATSGNDAGSVGAQSAPFKTITACINYISSNLSVSAGLTIQLATPGTYAIMEYLPILSCALTIRGDPNNQSAYQIARTTGTQTCLMLISSTVTFNGVTLVNPCTGGSSTIIAVFNAQVNLFNTTCTVTQGLSMGSGSVFQINSGGNVGLADGCIFSGNAPYGSWAFVNGGIFGIGNANNVVRTITFQGNPQYAYMFSVATTGYCVLLTGLGFSGAVTASQWSISPFGILQTSGRTGNFVPGSSSGNYVSPKGLLL